jgi:hypothetical protein
MLDKNRILQIVKERGPLIPRDVVKVVGSDTFMVGAILSQLVDSKTLKISYTKIGGSPVYYAEGQESRLQDLSRYLNEKEKKAFEMIKEAKVARDTSLEPVIRVAMRNIRDFAKPLEVSVQSGNEIFWKWYLCSNEEAERRIKDILFLPSIKDKTPAAPPEPAQETQAVLSRDPPATLKREETVNPSNLYNDGERPPEGSGDDLDARLMSIFSEKKVEILEKEILRKNSEIELIIRIPSPVGKLTYYCKVRNKKKCNDKDLSDAYVQGQMKKLPVLFVTTGDMTRKAMDTADKKFRMISIMHI